MEPIEDYTIRNGLGIRINNRKTCQVIRKQRNVWSEIGQVYELPVQENDLKWHAEIPASMLAVALRAFEMDHPNSRLRAVLTRNVARPRLIAMVASR